MTVLGLPIRIYIGMVVQDLTKRSCLPIERGIACSYKARPAIHLTYLELDLGLTSLNSGAVAAWRLSPPSVDTFGRVFALTCYFSRDESVMSLSIIKIP